ncbi:MAG: class I SAM-dependent RNA methyltransferase [Spirochaetaceae bacterium]|jgi:23S rRNA (uracil1939-C5)-methyltransferase|nr:class I SAM-dependent RNA methyltransferase [Spirochaetaceae bacterium]
MKTGYTFDARIESLAAGGAGVLRLEGRAFFMERCAPGDLVRGRVTALNGAWGRAELVGLLEASPDRAEPFCGLYGRCGGCGLQHVAYRTQLAEKKNMVMDALSRIGGLSYTQEFALVPGAPLEYRNRMRFHSLGASRGAPGIPGLKERRGNAVVALEDCPVSDPGIRRALRNKSLVVPPGKKNFAVYSREDTFLSEGGRRRGAVSIAGKRLVLDAAVFFQSNAALLEILIQDILKAADGADTKLPAADVFAGVGTFSAFLETIFPRMDLVEENKAALALASENLKKDARFFPLKDYEWASRCGDAYGFMVLDPPRGGLSPYFSEFLVERGAPLLAYVSCNPATLARDAKLLAGAYTLSSLKAYDFYPQTPHIECLAVFTREKGAL